MHDILRPRGMVPRKSLETLSFTALFTDKST